MINYERYNRIIGTLIKIANEGKTQGERDAAKRRITAIEEKIKTNRNVNSMGIDFDRLEKLNREAEQKAEADRKAHAEWLKQEALRKQEEIRIKEENKWKKRAERKQKQELNRQNKFDMRANWVNIMIWSRQRHTVEKNGNGTVQINSVD